MESLAYHSEWNIPVIALQSGVEKKESKQSPFMFMTWFEWTRQFFLITNTLTAKTMKMIRSMNI